MEIVPFLADHFSSTLTDIDDRADFKQALNSALSTMWHGEGFEKAISKKNKLKSERDRARFDLLLNQSAESEQAKDTIKRGSNTELSSFFTNFDPLPEHADSMLNLIVTASRQFDITKADLSDPGDKTNEDTVTNAMTSSMPKLIREALTQQDIIEQKPLDSLNHPQNILNNVERQIADQYIVELANENQFDELKQSNSSLVVKRLEQIRTQDNDFVSKLMDHDGLSHVSKNVVINYSNYKQTLTNITMPLVHDLVKTNNIPVKIARKLLTTNVTDIQKAIDFNFDHVESIMATGSLHGIDNLDTTSSIVNAEEAVTNNILDITENEKPTMTTKNFVNSKQIVDDVESETTVESSTEQLNQDVVQFDELFELDADSSDLIKPEQKSAFVSEYNSITKLDRHQTTIDKSSLSPYQMLEDSLEIENLVQKIKNAPQTVTSNSIMKISDFDDNEQKVAKFAKMAKVSLVLGVIKPEEVTKFQKTAMPFIIKEKKVPTLSEVQNNVTEENFIGYHLGKPMRLNTMVKSSLTRNKFSSVETVATLLRVENALPDLDMVIDEINDQLSESISADPLSINTNNQDAINRAVQRVLVDQITSQNQAKLLIAVEQEKEQGKTTILQDEIHQMQNDLANLNLGLSDLDEKMKENDIVDLLDLLSKAKNNALKQVIVETINKKAEIVSPTEIAKITTEIAKTNYEITKNPMEATNNETDDKMSTDYNNYSNQSDSLVFDGKYFAI